MAILFGSLYQKSNINSTHYSYVLLYHQSACPGSAPGCLPDHPGWDEIMCELSVRSKVEEGMADIEAGRTIPHEEVKAKLVK